jgi:carbon starvation protein
MTIMHKVGWFGLATLCAIAFGHVVGVLNPHEKVNGLWLVVAASCFYVLAYRFYGRFLAHGIGRQPSHTGVSLGRRD